MDNKPNGAVAIIIRCNDYDDCKAKKTKESCDFIRKIADMMKRQFKNESSESKRLDYDLLCIDYDKFHSESVHWQIWVK